jgi:putative toxin-antitoxin system antitoxin component (TIGR02293 family)
MVTAARIAETLGGARAFKRKHVTLEELRSQVRSGLPYTALEAVASGFEIGTAELVAVLRVPARTLARRKREKRLRSGESDRLYRLSRIATLAEEVLGGRDRATRWLHRSNRALGNATPLGHMDTELGARQVEDLLLRIAHGAYS